MRAVLIGERVSRFYAGDKFIFERVGRGEWKCVYQENSIIPHILIKELGE